MAGFLDDRLDNTIEEINGTNPLLFVRPFEVVEYLASLNGNSDSFIEGLRFPQNHAVACQLMYFSKYINSELFGLGKRIERAAIENHKEYLEENPLERTGFALSRFDDDGISLITRHLAYIQATQGCGGDCVRSCGVDAVAKVRDRIPEDHIIDTFEEVAKHRNRKQRLRGFYASDPLEIAKDSEGFFKIVESYHRLFNRPFEIVTSIPSGTEELYKELARRRDKSYTLCVSITEENIQRLYRKGIITSDDTHRLPLNPGNNLGIRPGVFRQGLCPEGGVNLILDEFRERVGLNYYNQPGRKFGFWNRNALVMTPYGVLNTVGISRIDRDYPQGRIVASVDRISGEPFDIRDGDNIEPYLTECVVRYCDPQDSRNRTVELSNLCHHEKVLIDDSGSILCHYRTSEPAFSVAKSF